MQTLLCHPATSAPVDIAIKAGVSCQKTGALVFSYVLEGGALRTVRVPVAVSGASPRRTERLWEQTCFEAFLAAPREAAYREFNFSPSGDWAAYDFSGYRENGKIAQLAKAPRIRVRAMPNRLELTAYVSLADALFFSETLEIGLSAVIENAKDASLTCWALRHRAERPDFHDRGGFIHALNNAYRARTASSRQKRSGTS
ncbi:MAG: DOMON-like domain-containing protein [Candidatus Accumulibacter sp.]|jgi:hypothetical protein|nr:DOMON-like domain-containing protein [Accumulibacter sp.]